MKKNIPTVLIVILLACTFSSCSANARKARHLARADRDFEAGEYDKAKINYMKVIQIDPRDARAFEQLGAIWFDEGAPLRAGAYLKRAQELAPDDVGNTLRLARVYLAIGQGAEAQKLVLDALRQSPENSEALLLLTDMARTPEDIDAAGKALQGFPEKENVHYQLGAANIALRTKDLAGAEAAVKHAIELAPKSPEAHQAMAILHLMQKNPKAASEEFKTAADLAPVRSNIRLTYADYLRETEGAAAGIAALTKITGDVPDFLPAWILLARIALNEKKYDEAIKYLENVFSRDPQNFDARLLQSDALLAKHDPTKAIEELERVDQAYPGAPVVKYRLGQAYLQQNNPSQAATALDQAIAKNPNFAEAIVLRAGLNLRTGQAAATINPLEDLLKKQPNLKPAQLLLADAYRATGRFDDAAAIFEAQIKAEPAAPEPRLFLGLVQQQQKKDDEARKSYEKVLELSPDNLLAITQLIDLDLEAKDYSTATRRVEEQVKNHPEAAIPYLLQAKVEMAQDHWKEAETAARKTLEIDSDSAPAYDVLVRSYLATNKLPEAAQELETVLAKAPKNQSALMTLGTIREQQKDYAKARDAYEKLLALNPDFIPALNNLSYLNAEHFQKPDQAYELAQKARTLDPGNAAVADTLGWAAFKRADYQQALTLFQESAGKSGSNPEIQFHLGMAHYMMGQTDAARDALQRAIAATGEFPSKAEAESRLKLLENASDSTAAIPVEQLEAMLKQQPSDLVVQMRLAEAYEKQGAWAKAAGAYEGALKVNPKLPSATLKLAQLYSGPIPDQAQALTYAKAARALSPNDPKTTGVLGRIAFDSGNFSWANDLLQESARQLASDPRVLHDLAWAAYSLGKVTDARDAMERSLQASPDAAIAADAKSFLALTATEDNSASLVNLKPEIESKLKADPKYVPALMAEAALKTQNSDKAAAVGRYQEVLQRFPDFTPAQKQLASLYADDPARITEAYDLAAKARKTLPDDPTLTQLLGELSFEKKDYARATQLLQESARKAPLSAKGRYYLGLAYQQQGRQAAAIEELTGALAAGLSEAQSGRAKQALIELQATKPQ